MSSNATNVSILEPWNPEVVRAHEISILVIVGVFGTLSTVLLGISLKNGWEELNGVRKRSFKVYPRTYFSERLRPCKMEKLFHQPDIYRIVFITNFLSFLSLLVGLQVLPSRR